MQVREVMTPDVTVVSPYASVCEAAQKMDRLNVGGLPVCDGNRLVGMITDRDIVVRSTSAGEHPEECEVQEVMSSNVRWCYDDEPVEQVQQAMTDMQIRRMPVVDRDKRLVGILTMGDLLTEGAPEAEGTLKAISQPSEPDRDYGGNLFEEDGGYRAMRPDGGYPPNARSRF
ncbi:MAG TPA: CBS domain-containing protein [Reyranella sp.]|jgi:CBS domain-containing protein|nr:CBS domain-containing protein [Reyranella sp.]